MKITGGETFILGVPAWLFYSLLTILFWGCWGLESKLIVDRTSPYTGQVLFTVGLVLPALLVLASPKRFAGVRKRSGLFYAILTGLLGGLGNVAFYKALEQQKTSIVVPLTSLFPLVTVLMAASVLREHISRLQYAGLALALVSIYLLSI
jgi:transporter family protein